MDKINSNNIDQWLFNYSEGDLSAQEVQELNNYLDSNPALSTEQELWNHANFKSIQIEKYPRLEAIQKGRGPWWNKTRIFFTITLIAVILILSYFFQYENNETNINETKDIRETEKVKENSGTSDADTLQKQLDLSVPISNESFTRTKPLRKTITQVMDSIPSIIYASSDAIPVQLEIEIPSKLGIKKPELIPLTSSEDKPISTLKPKFTPSKKQKRSFKKSKRKAAKKTFDRNASKEHDPKIIPIEHIGF